MKKSINEKEQCVQTDVMQSVLKCTDLRIGNLVYSKETNKIQNITGLTDENPFIDAITFDYTNYDEIEAIPITEEWLLKLGFINDKVLEFYRNDFTDSTIIIDYNFICLLGYSHVKLKYVHQLQNLHFALTGCELTVA